MRWFFLLLILVLAGGGLWLYSALRFAPPVEAPQEIIEHQHLPEHTSVVSLPIGISVKRIENALRKKISRLDFVLNASIPIGNKDKRIEKGKDMRGVPILIALDFKLVSLKLIPNGNNLVARVVYDLTFQAKLANNKQMRLADCGIKDEPPRIDFVLNTTYRLRPNGKVELDNKKWELAWQKPCKLTFLNITLEELLRFPEIKSKFETAIDNVVTNQIPEAIDLLPIVERTWTSLQQPLRLGPELYLYIQPEALTLGKLTGNAQTLKAGVAAFCKPQLGSGVPESKPPIKMRLTDTLRGTDSLTFMLTTSITMRKLNELLATRLKRHTFTAGGVEVRITRVHAYQHRNRIAFHIRLAKPFRGDVFLTAEPGYDSRSDRIVLRALDFSVASEEMLGRLAGLVDASLFKSTIEEELNKAAQASLGGVVEQFGTFSKDLKNNITIRGGLVDIQPVDMIVSDNRVYILSEVRGVLAVDVK